jgi:glucose-1-phosphate adenylyltransferase
VPVLEELHAELAAAADEGDTGLGDFGEHLLPRLVDRGKVVAHRLTGYWKDVGQPHHYLAAHRDLLTDDLGVLDQPGWPIRTQTRTRPPARVATGAVVEDSLLSPGCWVAGTVERSVIGPGVVVEDGATVRDSVLFSDGLVRSGAVVEWSVVDTGCTVEADAVVGEGGDESCLDDPDRVTLVGRGSTVGRGIRLPVGSRLEPGTTA